MGRFAARKQRFTSHWRILCAYVVVREVTSLCFNAIRTLSRWSFRKGSMPWWHSASGDCLDRADRNLFASIICKAMSVVRLLAWLPVFLLPFVGLYFQWAADRSTRKRTRILTVAFYCSIPWIWGTAHVLISFWLGHTKKLRFSGWTWVVVVVVAVVVLASFRISGFARFIWRS